VFRWNAAIPLAASIRHSSTVRAAYPQARHVISPRFSRARSAQAASFLVQIIRKHDHAEVAAFARTWPKGAQAYPHLAAGATLQRYVGTDGIPAAELILAAPTPKRPKAPAKHKASQRARH